MKFILVLLILLISSFAFSANYPYEKKIERGLYDFSVQGGAISSVYGVRLSRDSGASVVFPDNAIIKHCWLDVITVPDSAADGTTISLGIASKVDIVTAIAEASVVNTQNLIPLNTAATSVKLAADNALKAYVIGEALTSGKFYVYCEYVLGD